LEKFHNRINKLPISKQCQKYTNITKKIKKFEEKVKSKKILVLLEYINEKITNRAKICKTAPSQSKLQKQTNKQESKISKKLSSQKQTPKNSQKLKNKTFQENIKINYNYLKRNSILTPLS
jgi:septal ring factor EnvC (AmiA/AmiB activator)